MTEKKLGNTPKITDERDAVHVPIIPAKCLFPAKPGQPANISQIDNCFALTPATLTDSDGVIDPFLSSDINHGDVVWFCLKPGSIVSLTHNWKHPKVFYSEDREAAQVRLAFFAQKNGIDFNEMISRASCFDEYGSYWVEGGRFEGICVYDEFWDDYQKFTGKAVDPETTEYGGNFFSCSC